MSIEYDRVRAVLALATMLVVGLLIAHRELTPAALADASGVDIVGHIGGASYAVDVQGDYAYVGEGAQLTILDVSNPGVPVVAGKSPVFLDLVQDVVVEGNHAYVAVGSAGLTIIDVSTPSAPTVVGTLDDGQADLHAVEVVVAGQYAYVAADSGGLWIVDVTNPAAPSEVSATYVSDGATSLDVAGNFAYVVGESRLTVFDVTVPETPIRGGAYYHGGYNGHQYVAVLGNYAYIANEIGELEVVDISNSADPLGVRTVTFPSSPYGEYVGIAIDGNHAYVVDYTGGLTTIDISDPANPAENGYLAPHRSERVFRAAVVVAGDLAYYNDPRGLRIADVSDPSSPEHTSAYETLSSPSGLAAAGDYVFVAAAYAGLISIDAADPTRPSLVGSYDTPGSAYDVVVSGDYAYVADSFAGVQIIDVSEPTTPAAAGSLDGLGQTYYLDVEGSYAYVPAYDDDSAEHSLRVIDVSDPANPVQVGSLPGGYSSVDVVGAYAYVFGDNGFEIVDVSNPAAPVQVGSYTELSSVNDIQVVDDYAYLAYWDGLHIVNVADPAAPSAAGTYDSPGETQHLLVSGSNVYMADGSGGLRIIDVTDPELPVEVAYNDTFWADEVTVAGDHVFVGGQRQGLYVLEYLGSGDNDGQSDQAEDGAPNSGDGNNDGIPDKEQDNVVSLPNSENNSYMTLEVPAGIELVGVRAISNPSPDDTPAGASFPIGFLDFKIKGLSPGAAVAVTIILHGGETVDTYYKYGPEPGEPADHWYTFDFNGTTGAEFPGAQIVLHLVDGGRGDSDLTANGVIDDPGAPAFAAVAGTIVIVKDAAPADDTVFGFSETITGGGFTLQDPADNSRTFGTVAPGSYTVTEMATAGWETAAVTCDDDDSTGAAGAATINLADGETVTCTFVNKIDEDSYCPPGAPACDRMRFQLLNGNNRPDRDRYTKYATYDGQIEALDTSCPLSFADEYGETPDGLLLLAESNQGEVCHFGGRQRIGVRSPGDKGGETDSVGGSETLIFKVGDDPSVSGRHWQSFLGNVDANRNPTIVATYYDGGVQVGQTTHNPSGITHVLFAPGVAFDEVHLQATESLFGLKGFRDVAIFFFAD